MNYKELTQLPKADLEKTLYEMRAKLREARFLVAVGEHKKTHELGKMRKTIAQVVMLLSKPSLH